MVFVQVGVEHIMAGPGNSRHHPVRSDCDDSRCVAQGEGRGTELPLRIAEHRLYDRPHTGPVLRTTGLYRFSGINAVDDDIGARFDLLPLEEVFFLLVAREIDDSVILLFEGLCDGEEDRVPESSPRRRTVPFSVISVGVPVGPINTTRWPARGARTCGSWRRPPGRPGRPSFFPVHPCPGESIRPPS